MFIYSMYIYIYILISGLFRCVSLLPKSNPQNCQMSQHSRDQTLSSAEAQRWQQIIIQKKGLAAAMQVLELML